MTDLARILARLYPDRDRVRFFLLGLNLDPNRINLDGDPISRWGNVLEEASKHKKVGEVVEAASREYEAWRTELTEAMHGLRQPALATVPELDDDAWKGTTAIISSLERIIGTQQTFLPISFLETGLLRARAVVRVESPLGLGTGFLVRKNLLITNNHVISDKEDARRSKIWFNYQKTAMGPDAETAEFGLDPDMAFATSPMDDGDDWTAVRVKGNPNARWGALNLADVTAKVKDFVNIIQHPGGMPKQIALYHNVVVFADDSRVQYLTDTMLGSSGSPVFDSEWRVVALHHSGGWLPEPGTKKVFFRNEGIHIRALIKGLKEHRLY